MNAAERLVAQHHEDQRIVRAYLALATDTPLNRAAEAIGVGSVRLESALVRTGTRRHEKLVLTPPEGYYRAVARNRQPLPAGSPETWDVICDADYPA